MTRVLIFLGFQLAWFATAFSVTAKRPVYGIAMSVAVCAAHLVLRSPRARLALLALAAGVVGYAADTVLMMLGTLTFAIDGSAMYGSPLWMVLLWSNLALTIDVLPAWISARLLLTAVAGAIGGPLSYLAGERFDALHLETPRAWSIVAVAIEWTLAMPLLVVLERRIVARSRTTSTSRSLMAE